MPVARLVRMIGLPTDRNSSYRRGPAQAPAAIRAQLLSERGNAASENGLEIGAGISLEDAGDLPLTEVPEDDRLIEDAVAAALLAGRVPLCLGGDHSVTYPVLRAVARVHGPVQILHFDAHPDLYDEFDGNRRSHASPFARVMEDGLATRLVQMGIRTLNRHQRDQVERFGVEVIPMLDFTPGRVPALDGPLYVSIDLDGLDPAFAPGVSHPEPGGLSVRELLNVLAHQRAVPVAADVVELNPSTDINEMTAIVAAKLVKELLGYICRG